MIVIIYYSYIKYRVTFGNFWYNIRCLLSLSTIQELHCRRYIIQGVSLVISDTALGVSFQHTIVSLSRDKKEVIKSPGFPQKNYERNTNYTWYIKASDNTEEISIKITTDIHRTPGFSCEDYLQVCVFQSYFYINPLVIELQK